MASVPVGLAEKLIIWPLLPVILTCFVISEFTSVAPPEEAIIVIVFGAWFRSATVIFLDVPAAL